MVEGDPRCNRCKASKKGCDRQQPICGRCNDAGLKESDCVPEDLALINSRGKRRSTLPSGSMTSSSPMKRSYEEPLPHALAQFSGREIESADSLIHAMETRSYTAQGPRKKKHKPTSPESPQESIDTIALSSRTISLEPTRSVCGDLIPHFQDPSYQSNTGWPPQYPQEPPSPHIWYEADENAQGSGQQYFSENQAMKPTSGHNCYSCHTHSNLLRKLPMPSYIAAPGMDMSAVSFVSRQQPHNVTRLTAGQEIVHLIDGTSVFRNSVIRAATLHENGLPARRRLRCGDMITPVTLTTTARGDSLGKNWEVHRRALSTGDFDLGFGDASNPDDYLTEEMVIPRDGVPRKVLYVNMAPLSDGNSEPSFHGMTDEDHATSDNCVMPLTIGQALKDADDIHRAEKARNAETFYREVSAVDPKVLQNTLAEENFAEPRYFDEAFQGNPGP